MFLFEELAFQVSQNEYLIAIKADIAVLSLDSGNFGFVDAAGFKIKGDKKFHAELTIKDGLIQWDLNGLGAEKYH